MKVKQMVIIGIILLCVVLICVFKISSNDSFSDTESDRTDYIAPENSITEDFTTESTETPSINPEELLANVEVFEDAPSSSTEINEAEENSGKSDTKKPSDSTEINAGVSDEKNEQDNENESNVDVTTEATESKDENTLGELADVPEF